MRHVTIVSVFCLLFSWTLGYAEPPRYVETLDGSDWSEWPVQRKYNYITGFLSGIGYVTGKNTEEVDVKYDGEKGLEVFISYMSPDEKNRKNTFSRVEIAQLLGFNITTKNKTLDRYNIVEISNSQLVAGLDALYADFKNKRLKIHDTIYVVTKQIKGASPEEIEAVLQFLRSDRDFQKLFYTDKNGQKKYAHFP
jgi:hypothetical protein